MNVPEGYIPFSCSVEITTDIVKAVVGSPILRNGIWYIRILNNSKDNWDIAGTMTTLIARA